MPILKDLNGKNRYFNSDARQLLAAYILNPLKMPNGICGGMEVPAGVDIPTSIAVSMEAVAKHFHKEAGVQVRHFVVSYAPDETGEPMVVGYIAQEVTEWLSERYQVVYAVHEDTDNLHFHVMFNSVSYRNGRKYGGTYQEYQSLQRHIKDANHLFGINGLECVSNTSLEDIQ